MTIWSRLAAVLGLAGALTFGSANANAMVMTFDDVDEFVAVLTDLYIEDFEDAPWQVGFQAQPFEANGLFWTSSNHFVVTNFYANSTALSVESFDDFDLSADLTDLLQVQMVPGITAVGVFVSTLGQQHEVSIRAYDLLGNLLHHATAGGGTSINEFEFIGLLSTDDIARVDFVSVSGPPLDDFALDDLHYGTWDIGQNATSTDVAEPATLAMMASAMWFVILLAGGRSRFGISRL